MKRVALLGSTGSIGTNTLEVLSGLSDQFEVVSLCAGKNAALLCEQAKRFRPKRVCVAEGMDGVRDQLAPLGIEVLGGRKALVALAADPDVDLVVNGLAAGVGLRPTLSAVGAGKDVAIANKETLVVAGHLVTALAKEKGVRLLPIDSEMTPLWQTLQEMDKGDVKRVVLPASGGPFFDASIYEMARVTREEALDHPTWKMGPKITIDSATLMNKGFEVIEAQWFLGLPVSQVDVIIHRQSIVHCLIEFVDGGLMAHLSTPDMRLPIHYALFHPDRTQNDDVARFDPIATGALTFQALSLERYPCFQLGLDVAMRGGTWPAALCGADEMAVEMFLSRLIGFEEIPLVIGEALEGHQSIMDPAPEDILSAAKWARSRASRVVGG